MTESLSTFVVVFLVALAVSMVLIPVLMRLAPHIGMLDKPDARKVHLQPIPRAGGIGIVLGSLLPMMIVLPFTQELISYYIGALVLLVFGMWDDIAELGHYVKFVGQFMAAIIVVYYGGVVVESFPFMGLEPLPPTIGEPFTVIALVGVINAINHSDGLDGLAGGESLMSLAGILYLASQASGYETMVLCVAVMGGVFGFLRFNSHPARVFMGDGGSQFLGFSLAVFVVMLTQTVNPALSPAIPLLLLGLPIADILTVFWLRVRAGGSWFKATKNHIHHRLMELGFHHFESVTIIYTIQAALVFAAVAMPYAADTTLFLVYLGAVGILFTLLHYGEARAWRAHMAGDPGVIIRIFRRFRTDATYVSIPGMIVTLAVSAYMLIGSLGTARPPAEFAIIAAVLTFLLTLRLAFGFKLWFLMLRLLIFITIALIVYLTNTHAQAHILQNDLFQYIYFGALALILIVAIRVVEQEEFKVTPLDYLVALVAIALIIIPKASLQDSGLIQMVIHAILLFYGAELALRQMRARWNIFTVSILFALGTVAVRGSAAF